MKPSGFGSIKRMCLMFCVAGAPNTLAASAIQNELTPFELVAKAKDAEQMVELLHHKDPSVRAYTAQCLLFFARQSDQSAYAKALPGLMNNDNYFSPPATIRFPH